MSKRVKIGKPDARVAPTRTDGASSPSQSFTVSFSALLALGLALRLILIVYGIWHDAKHELKYTDVDYAVFSDAAAFIAKSASNGGHAQGPLAGKIARWLNLSYIGSPYVRATYRYTPLLALLLVPNVYIHALWGKFLFCASDLVAAGLQYRILRNTSIRHVTARQAKTYVAIIWLLNPFVANISTRGSAESVLAVMVLASLATAEEGRLIISAILLGLSAHFKLYPVIYGIAMMGRLSSGPSTSSLHINLRQLRYAGTAAASFALMNALMYAT
ncbi:GPI mannosyltransferase 1 [Cystobasidiomycetes sp. EMM_F5]